MQLRFQSRLLLSLIPTLVCSSLLAGCGSSEVQEVSPVEGPAPEAAASKPDFKAQNGWHSREPTNQMRYAEFVLCGDDEPTEDDPVVVVAYWPQGVGGRESNLTRWESNVTPAEGGAAPTTRTEDWSGMTVSIVDGIGKVTDMSASFESGRFIAAYIESAKREFTGVYTAKLSGDVEAIEPWADSFFAFLQDL